MSRYSREKGHTFEREIARAFREELGFEDCMTRREARGGDWSHTDDGTDLVHTWPYAVQCKRFIGYAPVAAFEEIHADSDEIPVLITKKNNGPTMAVLPWNDLKKLMRIAFPQNP